MPALWDCFSASQQRKFTSSKSDRSQKIGNFIEIEEKSVEKVVKELDILIIFLPQGGAQSFITLDLLAYKKQHSVELALAVLKCLQRGLQLKKLFEIGPESRT